MNCVNDLVSISGKGALNTFQAPKRPSYKGYQADELATELVHNTYKTGTTGPRTCFATEIGSLTW